MTIRRADVLRTDIANWPELLSDGYGTNSIYYVSGLVSTTAPNIITVILPSDDLDLQTSIDYQIDVNDIIYIYDTSGGAADGYYTVNSVPSSTTIVINETIANSTGGYVQLRYPAGATTIGLNPTGLTTVSGNTVQEAIDELDEGKLTPTEHETLRQLIHFLDNGPGDGFQTGAVREITPPGSIFPTAVTWYLDSTLTTKLAEKLITWSIPVPTMITWNIYQTDGITIAHTVTDTITYVNTIFEVSRIRAID
jgi:hypothetical protein